MSTYPALMILTDREGRSVSAAAVIEVRTRGQVRATSGKACVPQVLCVESAQPSVNSDRVEEAREGV